MFFRYLKQRFYPLLCILRWRLIPLPLSKARIQYCLLRTWVEKPRVLSRRRIRSQVSKAKKKGIIPNSWAWSPSRLLHVSIDDKKGVIFLAKKWYRLMLHHNLWHLWFIYIMSVVLFSSVTTLHVPKHYICGVSSDLHKLVIDFSKLNKI